MRLASALLLLAVSASAQRIDDSDLSRPAPHAARLVREGSSEKGRRVFGLATPGGVRLLAQPEAGGPRVTGRAVIFDETGAARPARLARVRLGDQEAVRVGEDGAFSLSARGLSGQVRLTLSLDNDRWRFENSDGNRYEWVSAPFELGPGGADLGDVAPFSGAENAKLGLVHLTFLEGLDFLKRSADAEWWRKTLLVRWPGDGDFFEPWAFALELTNADAWDVNLHELGHAVMNGAMRAAPAGGQHYIDRCYTPELAWSEGWATFFALAVRRERGDPDARMGVHMVPRRAPIPVENVPADVCAGSGSEWRVAAALWDLYDTHADGRDAAALTFSDVWRAARAGRTDGIESVWALLSPRIDAQLRPAAEASLIFNTVLPERPAPPPPDLSRLRTPNFDGRYVTRATDVPTRADAGALTRP